MTSDTKIPPEEDRFRANLLGLTDSLINIVKYLDSHGHKTVPSNILLIAKGIVEAKDSKGRCELIELMIGKSKAHWKKIHDKDEKFFIDNADDVFGMFKTSDVSVFKTLFTATDKDGKLLVGTKNRENLWNIIHSLVKIAIKYCHKHKKLEVKFLEEQITLWKITVDK